MLFFLHHTVKLIYFAFWSLSLCKPFSRSGHFPEHNLPNVLQNAYLCLLLLSRLPTLSPGSPEPPGGPDEPGGPGRP